MNKKLAIAIARGVVFCTIFVIVLDIMITGVKTTSDAIIESRNESTNVVTKSRFTAEDIRKNYITVTSTLKKVGDVYVHNISSDKPLTPDQNAVILAIFEYRKELCDEYFRSDIDSCLLRELNSTTTLETE